MKLIIVKDATTGKFMTVRADQIFKIEESESSSNHDIRMITFLNGETEFVTNSMMDLLSRAAED